MDKAPLMHSCRSGNDSNSNIILIRDSINIEPKGDKSIPLGSISFWFVVRWFYALGYRWNVLLSFGLKLELLLDFNKMV